MMKQRMPLTKKLTAFSRVLSYLISIIINLKTLTMDRIRPYRRKVAAFLQKPMMMLMIANRSRQMLIK